MITLSVLVLFTGFFILYVSIYRFNIPNSKIERLIVSNTSYSRILVIIFLVYSCINFIHLLGATVGMLLFAFSVMVVSGLVVMLKPLHIFTFKRLISIFVIIFIIEII